jgi:sigma-B regulation protein RsbU (phosphoserine phosphatase)
MFITLFCGLLDLGTGRLEFSGAGHNPPLLMHQDGTIEYLAVKRSPPVGILEEAPYFDDSLVLQSGDQLLIYTDGVTEARSETGDFCGEDRLVTDCTPLQKLPVQAALVTLLNELLLFQGKVPQSDDITMLLIRYHGPITHDPSTPGSASIA